MHSSEIISIIIVAVAAFIQFAAVLMAILPDVGIDSSDISILKSNIL
jgi:hypothetical protein